MDRSDASLRQQRAADQSEIRDVLLRYCRAIDRSDAELLLGVFHEDATFDTGHGEPVPPNTIISALGPATATHLLTNSLIEVEGNVAVAESYFTSFTQLVRHDGPYTRVRAGRYLDRFERRDGSWKIAKRILVDDWTRLDRVTATVEGVGTNAGRRSREDISYAFFRQELGREIR